MHQSVHSSSICSLKSNGSNLKFNHETGHVISEIISIVKGAMGLGSNSEFSLLLKRIRIYKGYKISFALAAAVCLEPRQTRNQILSALPFWRIGVFVLYSLGR